jgi:hypothetical protein
MVMLITISLILPFFVFKSLLVIGLIISNNNILIKRGFLQGVSAINPSLCFNFSLWSFLVKLNISPLVEAFLFV